MTDSETRSSDGLDLDSERLNRRRFLFGLGVIPVAALVPAPLLASERLELECDAGEAVSAAGRRLYGALFNPYHEPSGWGALARRRPEGMPLLGAYSGTTFGAAATQIIWAKSMGLDFFLAAYCPGRPSRGLDTLFEAAHQDDFKIGLYVDLEDRPQGKALRPLEERLAAGLEGLARYQEMSVYLHDSAGNAVAAVAGLDEGERLDWMLGSGHAGWSGPMWRFPAAWRYVPDAVAESDLARGIGRGEIYPGFSTRVGSRAEVRRIPSHSGAAAAVLVTPVRRSEGGVGLPVLPASAGSAQVVLLDAFNHWGMSVPLEPGTLSRSRYGSEVALWSREDAA